jgi:very-short-patch-repair endonuclease
MMDNKKRIYLDFLHIPTKSVIEFDGRYWHKKLIEEDVKRDAALEKMGYKVLRIKETYKPQEWLVNINIAISFILGRKNDNTNNLNVPA